MGKTYEFKIEDIQKVKIITVSDECKYTTICTRIKDENGNDTRTFLETYSAKIDRSKEATVGIICPKCGSWSYFDEEDYNREDFEFECGYCKDKENYSVVYSEKDLRDLVLSFFEEESAESFNELEIYINDILIK